LLLNDCFGQQTSIVNLQQTFHNMTDQKSVEEWIGTQFQILFGRKPERYITKSLLLLAKTYPDSPEQVLAEINNHVRVDERIFHFVKMLLTKTADITTRDPIKPKQSATQKEFQTKLQDLEKKLIVHKQEGGTITRGYLIERLNTLQSNKNYDQFVEFLKQVYSDEYLKMLLFYDKYLVFEGIQSFSLFLRIASLHSDYAAQFLQQKKVVEAEKEYGKAMDLINDITPDSGLPTVLETRRVLDRHMYQFYSQKSDTKKSLLHFRSSLICQAIKDGKTKDAIKWRNATEKELAKAMQDDMIVCDNPGCKKQESFHGEFKRCSKCKKSVYCSRDCQVKHWAMHKAKCSL
jgi:hypothetical protein